MKKRTAERCAFCERIFDVKPRGRPARFCSSDCRVKAWRVQQKTAVRRTALQLQAWRAAKSAIEAFTALAQSEGKGAA